MKWILSILLSTIAGTLQAADSAPSFVNDVLPTLTRNGCNSGACHGALAGKGGFKLSLRGYDPEADHFAITRQVQARRVDSQVPMESLLLKKAARLMPHGGGRRFEEESEHFKTLHDWIAASAPGPSTSDAKLLKLEIEPTSRLGKPKDAFKAKVTGHYSDGRVRDVTHWVRFTSSEDLVADVDEDGKVTVAGHGEAAIIANFGNRLAICTVTSPFTNPVSEVVFAKSPRGNFIDDHVLAKLKLLNLPPSAQSTDAEFVRRVYLDTCGILPKPAEVDAFLNDKAPNKRAKLIDALLARPEFVDYWSHKWSDVFLVSSRRLPQPAVAAFYRHVRQNVADNTPWDQFARNLVTASGSTLSNGAANFFVLHKDTADLFESTSIAFLGLSMGCCKCHNHPLEKWTQDQYWATANLFSRVALKNGDRAGEVFVQSQPGGDAFHLRRGVPMPPTPFDGEAMKGDGDRREFFAHWLTAKENAGFAKAIVNRVWKNYMGRGLVEAEDDLRESNPPSNAALFDALAADFIKHKYDTKHLMRMILNSAAYQRSSKPIAGNVMDDKYYSRYLLRRLSAEVILDAYADITGVPSNFDLLAVGVTGGTAKTAVYPLGTRAMQLPDSQLVSQFLDAFGRAERDRTCACEVTKDASVTQALHLNNGKSLNDKLRDKNSIVTKWLEQKTSDDDAIRQLYRLALARDPRDAEWKALRATLKDDATPRREAFEDIVWAVLTSQEFLFNR